MKIPAIRANIGNWIYYVATLSFKQVNDYVKKIDDELHKSKLLSEMLQRSITDNYKSIATYIKTHEDRFFNALILAVYDGEPQWHEVRLEYDTGEEFVNLGVLELTGEEKIFPVDGQHRVEGIKKVLLESEEYNEERIPVVFIGHKKDEMGMRRARQLFSTLNRYAKPVSMRDIIALDEDDIIAITSRELIDEHRLFANNRILDTKNKAIPDTNKMALTTIITFYECNRELLADYIKHKKKTNKSFPKLSDYIRIRPNDKEIEEYKSICFKFWDSMISGLECIQKIADNPEYDVTEYRNENGGLIIFRPVALVPLIKAIIRVKNAMDISFEDVIKKIPLNVLELTHPVWKWVIWNPDKRTMIMGSKVLIESIIIYYLNETLLTSKEKAKLLSELKSCNQLTDENDVYDNILNADV